MTATLTLNVKYIAEDQYGNVVWIKAHPRKELMEWVGRKSAQKVYLDTKEGNTFHVGYRVGQHWFSVYGLEGNSFATKAN